MRFKHLFLFLFILVIFVTFFIPQSDVDFGWHYTCGKLLLAGNPCINNNFTYYLSDYKWAYSSFLFDAMLYLSYEIAGFVGSSIVYSIVMSIFAFLLLKSAKLNKVIFILLFSIATFFSWGVISYGLRPQIFTLIYFTLFLSFLTSQKLVTFRMLWIALFFVIWVNTHVGIFLGPLIFILFVLSELVTNLFKFVKIPKFKVLHYFKNTTLKGYVFLVSITITSILATFLNPFGTKVYGEIFRHSITPLNTLIAEWTSPKLSVMIVMFVLYLFFIFIQFINKKLLLFSTAVVTMTLYFALSANRNVPLFFFSYIVCVQDLSFIPSSIENLLNQYGQKLVLYILITFLVFFSPFLIIYTIKNSTYSAYCNGQNVKYPCKAIELLKDKRVRIYNRYEWGGFLIWQLPQAKIYIDGRMPAWIDTGTGKSPYSVWLNIYQTKTGWNKKLDDLKTDYLLISPYTFIDIELTANPEKYMYKEVYRDEISVIYERE